MRLGTAPIEFGHKKLPFLPSEPTERAAPLYDEGKDRGREGEIAAAERLNNSFGFRQANQTSLSLPPSDCRRTKGDVWKEEVVDREEATGGTLELDFKNSRVKFKFYKMLLT